MRALETTSQSLHSAYPERFPFKFKKLGIGGRQTMKRKRAAKQRKSNKRIARREKGNPLPFKKPNTARQYFSLSPKNQEIWDSVGHVVSKMREGVTLPKAAREFGLAPKTVIT